MVMSLRVSSCQYCGALFSAGRRGPLPSACPDCRVERIRLRRRTGRSRYRLSSESARAAAMARWSQTSKGGRWITPVMHGPPGPCRVCGSLLVDLRSSIRLCRSRACILAHRAARQRDYQPRWDSTAAGKASRQRRTARRRAAKRLVRRVEYERLDIFERDRWTCQLCGEPVRRTLQHPDPRSASIDHILPLAMGGEDVPWNVQLAHLGCNSSKRDRASNDQLRLAIAL